MSAVLAIDPGASGGIAWLDKEGAVDCKAMPQTPGDVLFLLRFLTANGIRTAFVEEVGGFCGVGLPGSAMFNLDRKSVV